MTATKVRRWIVVGLAALVLALGGLGATGAWSPEGVAAIGKASGNGTTPPDCSR